MGERARARRLYDILQLFVFSIVQSLGRSLDFLIGNKINLRLQQYKKAISPRWKKHSAQSVTRYSSYILRLVSS